MKPAKLTVIAVILSASTWAQEIAPMSSADEARVERMIAIVQRTPASKLDRKLPRKTAFQDWLYELAGADARMNWVVREGNSEVGLPDCVEAAATMKDGKLIIVLVAADRSRKRVPYVYQVIVSERNTTGKFDNTDFQHPTTCRLTFKN